MLYFHVTHRSTQMSASVDADVRNGRRRCPQRSTQMSATVDADDTNRSPTECTEHAEHTKSEASVGKYDHGRLRGYGRDAIPSYNTAARVRL